MITFHKRLLKIIKTKLIIILILFKNIKTRLKNWIFKNLKIILINLYKMLIEIVMTNKALLIYNKIYKMKIIRQHYFNRLIINRLIQMS
jgi:hypothetical protein